MHEYDSNPSYQLGAAFGLLTAYVRQAMPHALDDELEVVADTLFDVPALHAYFRKLGDLVLSDEDLTGSDAVHEQITVAFARLERFTQAPETYELVTATVGFREAFKRTARTLGR